MSRYCGDDDPKSILEAAIHWRDAALLGSRSILTNQPLWTPPVLDLLDEHFVRNPDLGDGKFLEKLESQLAPAAHSAKQLVAELMWLLYLCPSSLTAAHKRKTIQAIWSWSGETLPTDSRWLDDDVLAGVGSAGPGFNQNQWRELVFLINFLRRFSELTSIRQLELIGDGWAFDEWLRQVPDWEARQFRHMLLFLLFPDDFERIFGQNDRKTIVRHYSKHERRVVNRMDPVQLDRELQAIRKRLETERGTTQLDYYVPPLKGEWRSETFAAATENVTAEHIRLALHEIDQEGVPKDAESTGYDLIYDGKRYPPKLVLSLAVKQATGEPLDRAAFSGGEASSAFRLLRRLDFEVEPKEESSDGIPELLNRFLKQASDGRELGTRGYLSVYRDLKVRVSFGKGNFARIPWIAFLGDGQSVNQGIYPVLLLYAEQQQLLLCYGVSEEGASRLSWGELAGVQTVKEWFKGRYGRVPDRYDTSFVRATYDLTQPLPMAELQQDLDDVIDIYSQVLAVSDDNELSQVVEPEQSDEPLPVRADLREAIDTFSTALRASGVKFGDHHDGLVTSFISSLVTKPLVILTGLSGSGKTQIAIRFGEWLGKDRLHVAAVRPDWTGAEALFGYEDALKRELDGRRAWTVPAPLEFILKAAADPQHPYLLLLDEMNLAHVERYFADVLSGMESGQPCIPNLHKGTDDCWRLKAGADKQIPLPANLWIVGTVNIDETTYMFSPKVLDRANTFEFRVHSSDLSTEAIKPQPCVAGDQELVRGLLSIAQDDSWHRQRSGDSIIELTQRLRQLHELLSRYNLEFGHRVFYEAIRFATLVQEAGINSLAAIVDRIVMQKVLPRLHGSRRRLESPLLAIAHFCRDLPDSVAADDKLPTLEVEALPEQGAALPISYAKAIRMLRSLRANQFASFTE
ncbi:5-methylcytosine-specific restriction enzyme B [Burkholderia orbicola]|uniref:MrcB family domain-containing protein n=1 Tax=Burkholderia orbicola TaxID=2978683 RepID=UPI000891C602|nr:5-methylcytosine-specific restriction enzyme B [Burkholderia orbicola]